MFYEAGHGKVIEKTLPEQSVLDFRGVLGIVPFGGTKETRTNKKPLERLIEQTTINCDAIDMGKSRYFYSFRVPNRFGNMNRSILSGVAYRKLTGIGSSV